MLKLNKKITLSSKLIKEPDLTGYFDDADLTRIGDYVWDGYTKDCRSREAWERRTNAGMDLAMQVVSAKTFPWPNCSNIAFPLVTIAAMQFHAIAYPAIVQGNEVVKSRTIGPDPTGQLKARSERISCHMSYQMMEGDKGWEEQHDRLLINLSIVGGAFKKTYYSSSKRHNVSELVLARDLVLDYYASSVDACGRKTHSIPLYRNEIYERVMRRTFRDVLEDAWYKQPSAPQADQSQAGADNRMGLSSGSPDGHTPFETLEQHCSLDLDQDGYAEPYIITLEKTSKTVLRIVTRFDREEDIERTASGNIICIRPMEYFTNYTFIPSPDGGVYGIGFGVLLGPLNESTSSLINQLVDAGTMAVTAGGFLGRGAKIRGGTYTFAPLEWKRVDSTGDDLKKSIFPLPVREPSQVLFNLLSLLINYTQRIYGGVDSTVGESTGQNTPAETSRNMLQQGMKIYNVIFKRIWRSMKEEFKKAYILNGIFMPTKQHFGAGGSYALREDYLGDPDTVVPAADPHLVSEAERFSKAQALRQAAHTAPGYNIPEVEKNFLRAMKVEGIDVFYPGPDKVPPLPNPKMQVEQVKLEGKKMQFQHEQAMFAAGLMETRRLNSAKIAKLQADVADIIASIGVDKAKLQLEAFSTAIGALQENDEALRKHIELLMKGVQSDRETSDGAGMGRMAPPSSDQGGSSNPGFGPGGA